MKLGLCFLSLVSAATIAGTVQANTYVLPLTCTGFYWTYDVQTIDVDFGTTFSSIQTLKIDWTGWVNTATATDMSRVDQRFQATIGPASWASTGYMGNSIGPDPQAFNLTSVFSPDGSAFDVLLDGRDTSGVQLWPLLFSPASIGSPGSAYLSSVALILEGNPVPEPSGMLCLLIGILGCASGVCSRRRPTRPRSRFQEMSLNG